MLHGDEASEIFYRKLSAHKRIKTATSAWSLFTNTAVVQGFGVYTVFNKYDIPVTVFGVTMAMQRHPDAVKAMMDSGWEIASHAMRWCIINMDEEQERKQIDEAIILHE